MLIESGLTRSLDKAIEKKEWMKLENAILDVHRQSYKVEELEAIALVLLYKVKELSESGICSSIG